MGSAFSFLSGFLRRRRNPFGVDSCPLSNHPCDVDSKQDENKYCIQIGDHSDGDDPEFDRNKGDDCVKRGDRPLMETPKAVTCTNNIQISSVENFVAGDNVTINVAELEQKKTLNVVHLHLGEEQNTVNDETQLSTRPTVTNNIKIQDSNIGILAIGSAVFNLQNAGDRMFNCEHRVHPDLQEALRFDPSRTNDLNIESVRVQLFPSPLQLPSEGVEPRLALVFDVMCRIVDQLYPLRDRGEWQEFESALYQLQTKYDKHPEIKCFLLLEESVKLTYQKRLKAAKRKAKEGLSIINNKESTMRGASQDVLVVLGKVASASIYRRLHKKKLGKAFKCLEDAKDSGERLKNINSTMPKFALALLDYELPRLHMAFATSTNNTKHCNKEAVCTMLGRCIERCRNLSDESHLYTARQSFALLYLARLSLPTCCHSLPGQCERVKQEPARQTEKLLDEYHRSHRDLENSPVAARVKYSMTRSELCFMRGNYAQAKELACLAVETAEKYGFELETVPAQTHLDQICRHCASATRQVKLPVVKELPSDCSSSTTTDSDQKYTALTGSQRET